MIEICEWCHTCIVGGLIHYGDHYLTSVCDACAKKHWLEHEKQMLQENKP